MAKMLKMDLAVGLAGALDRLVFGAQLRQLGFQLGAQLRMVR